ncbi:unnamed protein product [Mytilus coruscus]|uniref:Uncharacterized protein n=1 Tax=Mytilus coruscus TaxID=42192 RepID=A0A6J8CG81_MYTCO|nr:unnamed protein product [Mytilus coruscus]
MLSNGNVLIADYVGNNVIKEYSEDGKHIRDIPCSNGPFDLTVIDSDCIAVTYGDKKYVEILDMKNNTVVRKVIFNDECHGISYQENKLFIIIDGIVITDITGRVLQTLDIDCGSYLKTIKDRIYFTCNSTVNCISMAGEKIWEHTEKSSGDLFGITVDDHENVYVTDVQSNTLIAIQHAGRCSRTLLTETDGLHSPCALYYNKYKKALLMCNEAELVFLYNLVEY